MEKDLLKKLGEETIYTAKGHFKACDIRRNLITFTIWICLLINVLGIYGFNEIIGKVLAAVGLFGTIALLVWNQGDGSSYRANHKLIAEKYLSLHKEIRDLHELSGSKEEVKEISKKVRELDNSDKMDIPWIARKWAQKAIQEFNETNNWFLK